MRMMVIRLVSPPAPIYGYLRRFMIELEAGLLVGSCTRPLLNEVLSILRDSGVKGYVLLPEPKSEAGFSVPYFSRDGHDLLDSDGVVLVRTREQSEH